MYPFKELVEKWINGHLTVEQVIGQILRHLEEHREQDKQQRRRIHELERQVLELQMRLDPPDASGGRPVKR